MFQCLEIAYFKNSGKIQHQKKKKNSGVTSGVLKGKTMEPAA